MKVRISAKNFNPLMFELQKHIADNNVRQIIVYGGTSAGKTFTIAQLLMIDGLNNKYSSAVFKKESTTIDSHVYNDFKTIRDKFKFNPLFKFLRRIIRYGKNEIRFFGLDDPEKAKGISAFKKIYCNELSKFNESDYDELLDRMRGIEGQQLICDFNPITEKHWIKTKIFDSEDFIEQENKYLHPTSYVKKNRAGDIVIIKTTYLDNFWVVGSRCGTYGYIDKHVIERYKKLMETDYNRYAITALGEWGIEQSGMRYYGGFSNSHVKPIKEDTDKAYIITFDFNVVPYQTCLICQATTTDGIKEFKVIKELCLSQPLNNTLSMSREILKVIGHTRLPVFIYGDYSGANRSGLGMDYKGQTIENHYEIVETIFKAKNIKTFNNISPNENLIDRHDFLQSIFTNELNISFSVDGTCKNTIDDLLYCTYDKDGKKLKRVIKDKATGESYQERGHCSDALEYVLCGIFKNEFNSYRSMLKR